MRLKLHLENGIELNSVRRGRLGGGRFAARLALASSMVAISVQRFGPRTHTVTEFAIPANQSQPERIVTGPDGAMWFTEYKANNIGRTSLRGQNTIAELPVTTKTGAFVLVDGSTSPTNSSLPLSIVCGHYGALWFTEQGASQIGRLQVLDDQFRGLF